MSQLEHIGIAISDTDAIATFERLLQVARYKAESVASEAVETHFIDVGGPRIELLTTDHADSAIGRFLTRRGEGIHHLAFEVDDIDAAFRRVQDAGFVLASKQVSDGADGKRVFFLHPRSTHGVLVEFCQSARSVLDERVVDISGESFTIQRGGLRSGRSVLLLAPEGDRSATDLLARALEPAFALTALVRRDTQRWPAPVELFDAIDALPGESGRTAILLGGHNPEEFLSQIGPARQLVSSVVAFTPAPDVLGVLSAIESTAVIPRTLLATTGLSAPVHDAASRHSSFVDLVTVPVQDNPYSTRSLPLLIPTVKWFLNREIS